MEELNKAKSVLEKNTTKLTTELKALTEKSEKVCHSISLVDSVYNMSHSDTNLPGLTQFSHRGHKVLMSEHGRTNSVRFLELWRLKLPLVKCEILLVL